MSTKSNDIEDVAAIIARRVPNKYIRENNEQYWKLIGDIQALIETTVAEARVDARERLLSKLTKTYNPKIAKPIEDSPMELTDEAKHYNRFVDDLNKFVEIERNKNLRQVEQLTRNKEVK